MDNSTLLTKNNKQATVDLVTFLEKFFGQHLSLQNTPFFVVAESYGGKFATELGVALQEKGLVETCQRLSRKLSMIMSL